MRLELGSFPIDEVALGDATRFEGRRLSVSAADMEAAVAHPAIAGLELGVVHPGEATRITQISDVVEPRIKSPGGGHGASRSEVSAMSAASAASAAAGSAAARGGGDVFPGLLGPLEPVGHGRTHRLAGMAVMVCGEVPWLGASGLFVPRDNFIDTGGPGADCTPHSQTVNLVVRLTFAEGFAHEEYQQAVVLAGLRAARRLAATTLELTPADVVVRDLSANAPDLPRVLYAYQVQSQGVFMRTYLNGRPLDDLFPTLLHPNELADGVLVAGGLGGGSVKLTTWLHQNNPLVDGLYARNNVDWNFAGIILHRGHYYQYEDKQRVALQVARLAQLLHADGVVFTLGGGGNNITEVMLAIQACERQGIKTVLLAWEHGGPQGADYPLPFAVPEATAIVSTGSMDAAIDLPAMARVVGPPTIRVRPEVGGIPLAVDGVLNLDNRYELFGDANAVGWQRTGCREW